ncbi:unnamed protein product [Mucor hiemalis]
MNKTSSSSVSKIRQVPKAKPKSKSKENPAPTITENETPPQPIENDENGLTQEEIEMNAIAAARRRNKKLMSAPSPLPISADSPTSAPSPIAPILYRPDCALEASNAPVLKIERITPGLEPGRKSMSRALKAEANEDDEADIKTIPESESPSPRIRSQESTPIDIIKSSPVMRTASPPLDMDIDMDMDFDIPSPMADATPPPQSPTPTPNPPLPSPSPVVIIRKNKGKRKATETDSDFFAPKPKRTATTKATKTSKPTKPRKTRNGGAGPSGSSGKSFSAPSNSKAIAISIGAPSTSEEKDVDEEIELDEDGMPKSSKKKDKRKDRFEYRLPENMKTLDDITNDPARVENLEKPMSVFTKDIEGIVSKTFKETETARYAAKKKLEDAANMSPEELAVMKEKEKEEAELLEKKKKIAKEREEERRKREAESSVLAESSNALQVRLINGQIVLDTDSLTIERTEADRDFGDGTMEIVEENAMSRKVNSQTYGKRQQSNRWNELETEQFYDCISQFGTDFEMISMVMPGRTRSQIRAKFNREERIRPEKITDYLIRKKKPLDLQKYQEAAGIELETVPEDFHELQLA